jgi:hypothetical protein
MTTKFLPYTNIPINLPTRSGTEIRVFKNAGEKMKGLPLPPHGALAYGLTRFCFGKNTKPEHERDPQAPAIAADTPTPP